jgi:AraC-like DNA-binding protein
MCEPESKITIRHSSVISPMGAAETTGPSLHMHRAPEMERAMLQGDGDRDTPLLDIEAWRASLRTIRDGFSDPDFGPLQVAAEAGISLRYVQKLFAARGSTCSEFIYSHRLDHSAHLLRRRGVRRTGQSLSEIAYACGFRGYAISHENSAAGSVTRRAPALDGAKAPLTKQCALVQEKVRHWLTTFGLRRHRFDLQSEVRFGNTAETRQIKSTFH